MDSELSESPVRTPDALKPFLEQAEEEYEKNKVLKDEDGEPML